MPAQKMNGHQAAESGSATTVKVEILPQGTVLIAGGGPVGLTLATVLAFYGVKSVVLERNETTTRFDCPSTRIMTSKLISGHDQMAQNGSHKHSVYGNFSKTRIG